MIISEAIFDDPSMMEEMRKLAGTQVRRLPASTGFSRSDLIDVALIELWKVCKEYEGKDHPNFYGFATVVMKYGILSALNEWRGHRGTYKRNANVMPYIQGLTPEPCTEDDTTNMDLDRRMRRLTHRQRQVITLLRLGFTKTEISDLLKVSFGAIDTYAQDAAFRMKLVEAPSPNTVARQKAARAKYHRDNYRRRQDEFRKRYAEPASA